MPMRNESSPDDVRDNNNQAATLPPDIPSLSLQYRFLKENPLEPFQEIGKSRIWEVGRFDLAVVSAN